MKKGRPSDIGLPFRLCVLVDFSLLGSGLFDFVCHVFEPFVQAVRGLFGFLPGFGLLGRMFGLFRTEHRLFSRVVFGDERFPVWLVVVWQVLHELVVDFGNVRGLFLQGLQAFFGAQPDFGIRPEEQIGVGRRLLVCVEREPRVRRCVFRVLVVRPEIN